MFGLSVYVFFVIRSVLSFRSLAVRAGFALASLDAVFEEAIVWQFVLDLADELQHFLVVEMWLTGQDPEEVERGQAKDVAAGVDDAVRLVVGVEDGVVSLVAGRWRVATEGDDEGGVACVSQDGWPFDTGPALDRPVARVLDRDGAIVVGGVLRDVAAKQDLERRELVAVDLVPGAKVAVQVKFLHRAVVSWAPSESWGR